MFSSEEIELLQNSEMFVLKRKIFEKLSQQAGCVIDSLKAANHKNGFKFPDYVNLTNGKISKGENYEQLPWMMIDFPFYFSKQKSFAFRTFIGWSKGVTCSLLLTGECLNHYEGVLRNNLQMLNNMNVGFCEHPHPWVHNFDCNQQNFVEHLDSARVAAHISHHDYIKLSCFLPMSEIEHLEMFAQRTYTILMSSLNKI